MTKIPSQPISTMPALSAPTTVCQENMIGTSWTMGFMDSTATIVALKRTSMAYRIMRTSALDGLRYPVNRRQRLSSPKRSHTSSSGGQTAVFSISGKMLFASTNWSGSIEVNKSSSSTIEDNTNYHESGEAYSLIKLKGLPDDIRWKLIAYKGLDGRIIPFDIDASSTKRGWYYAKSLDDLSANFSDFNDPITGKTKKVPLPSNVVVVNGGSDDLSPDKYVFADTDEDASMCDQEILRNQIKKDFPMIDNIFRLYEDYEDLKPTEMAAAPVAYITRDAMQNRLKSGMHFVSLSGHGWYGGCCNLDPNMADVLDNGYHAFIAYADSCLTNKFDAEDSVSEKLLYNPRGGAVAYIGNTRFSWVEGGDEFQRAFFDQLHSTTHLGLLNDSRCNLEGKWTVFSLNLVGDPEMSIWIGPPESMNVELLRPETAQSSFKLIVSHKAGCGNPSGSNANIPVDGAAVHISSGDISGTAYTDPSGTANFNICTPVIWNCSNHSD